MALAAGPFQGKAGKGVTYKQSVGIFGKFEASKEEGLGALSKKQKI